MHKGFLTVLAVADVVKRLCALPRLGVETVKAHMALGRILAAPVLAYEDVPPASRSGMDGYAVRAADTFGASEGNPVWLDCVGQVPIDQPVVFALQPGQCAAVVTGSHLPQGADSVIMIEHTREFGDEVIEMRRSVAPGEAVMLQGEDVAAGAVALVPGTLMRPQELGLLAALGHTRVTVYCRPKVALFSTGDELVPAAATPKPGQIRDVNSQALAAMVQQAGGELIDMTGLGQRKGLHALAQKGVQASPPYSAIVPDDLDCLVAALRLALDLGADVVLLSGGSSVGVRDLTLSALNQLDATQVFCHGVALSPGKPLILAQSRSKFTESAIIWGLPGQVTSAQVVMHILGTPCIRHLAGHENPFDQSRRPLCRARLTRNIASRQGREDYVRVRLTPPASAGPKTLPSAPTTLPSAPTTLAFPDAVPLLGLSGLMRTLLDAQGVMRIPAELEGLEAGTLVDVLLFD